MPNVRIIRGGDFAVRMEFDAPDESPRTRLLPRYLQPIFQGAVDVAASKRVQPLQRRYAVVSLLTAARDLMTDEVTEPIERYVPSAVKGSSGVVVSLETANGWPFGAGAPAWAGALPGFVLAGVITIMIVRALRENGSTPKKRTPASEPPRKSSFDFSSGRRERERQPALFGGSGRTSSLGGRSRVERDLSDLVKHLHAAR